MDLFFFSVTAIVGKGMDINSQRITRGLMNVHSDHQSVWFDSRTKGQVFKYLCSESGVLGVKEKKNKQEQQRCSKRYNSILNTYCLSLKIDMSDTFASIRDKP